MKQKQLRSEEEKKKIKMKWIYQIDDDNYSDNKIKK